MMGTLVGRIVLVAALLIVGLPLGAMALEPWLAGGAVPDPGEAQNDGLALIALALSDAVLLVLLAAGARRRGSALVGALALVLWGSAAAMPQVESAFFPAVRDQLPDGFFLAILGLWGALALGAAWIAAGAAPVAEAHAAPPVDPIRFMVVALAYPIVYLAAGWWLAWSVPAVRDYYGGVASRDLLEHLGNVLRDMPMLVPFQLLRGLLWTGLAVLVTRTVRYGTVVTSILTGLALSMPMSLQLLFSNPFMPEVVRMTHLVETGLSTFLFGLLAGLLLADAPSRLELPKERWA